MTKLLIVESPKKAKLIRGFLGSDWIVEASFGHVRDLPVNEMGVEPPDFRPKYVAADRGKSVLSKLRSIASSVEAVFLATDPDREGEAIAWHLKDALRLKSAQRASFQEITKGAVAAALKAPRQIDQNLVYAQEARRVADRVVGYLVSPALSDKAGQRLSAGRVQSVSVRLVVERERDIEAHQSVAHYGARLHFLTSASTGAVEWTADWDCSALLSPGQDLWVDRAVAEQAAAVRDVVIDGVTTKNSSSAAPPPFTTSTLQQAASVSLGINPKKTMELAQSLFDEGLISYHRTDSRNLSAEAVEAIRNWAVAQNLSHHLPAESNRWASKEGAQEAHEAIRPTNVAHRTLRDTSSTLANDPLAAQLYEMIWIRAVASQLKPALFDVTTVDLSQARAANPFRYKAIGRVLVYPGWKALTMHDAAEEQDEDSHGEQKNQRLPDLLRGAALRATKGETLDKKTKPPARYTEASLVKELESRGIGRPSTYASILDNIIGRGYVSVRKKKLHAETLGMLVVDLLVGTFGFMEYSFTRDIEKDLDDVAEGKLTYIDVVGPLYAVVQKEVGSITGTSTLGESYLCPTCGGVMRRRPGKHGSFWGCSGYPKCKTTLPDADGKPGDRTTAQDGVSTSYPCPACSKPMQLRRSRASSEVFWGCSGYPVCKTTLPDMGGIPGQRRAV